VRDAQVLTERELEVLQLLPQRRSSRAIAEELIVAFGTVKQHVNNSLGKLQVPRHLKAVARARDLQIV
jgi:ATP/maltotriose-dependent transcriptional regulator MalT